MPIELRKFKREIERFGYSIMPTSKGHYWVITPAGGKLVMFAVSHGSSSRGGEVWDSYVNFVRKEIERDRRRL